MHEACAEWGVPVPGTDDRRMPEAHAGCCVRLEEGRGDGQVVSYMMDHNGGDFVEVWEAAEEPDGAQLQRVAQSVGGYALASDFRGILQGER